MRVLIIEDELSISEGLTSLFSKSLEHAEIHQAYCLADAERLIENHIYDLISIDLQLPDGNGLDFAKAHIALFKNHQTEFIVLTGQFNFETAYVALNELDCLKYLPKPIVESQFKLIIESYLQKYHLNVKPLYFIFKNKFMYLRIAYDEILYFERSLTDCLLYTAQGTHKLGRLSISALQNELNGEHFVQIHRSMIVNWNQVKCLHKEQSNWQLELNNLDSLLPVGKTFYHKLPL